MCPMCGKSALAFAVKCPNDGTVIYKKYHKDKDNPAQTGGKAVCPKCKWDPEAARREELGKLNKQHGG